MGTAKSIGGYDGGKQNLLHHQLNNIADNLEDLICPEWFSALDTTNELHRLQKAVDDHSLN
jgi:hypothetical protein